jgi:hypothetical protein
VSGDTALPSARSWLVRPYRDGDERQLVGLFERVFGRPMSEAHWRWKLRSRAAALGWQRLFPLRWLLRVIRPTALAARKLGVEGRGAFDSLDRGWSAISQVLSRPDRTVTFERILAAGSEFDRFWKSVEQACSER